MWWRGRGASWLLAERRRFRARLFVLRSLGLRHSVEMRRLQRQRLESVEARAAAEVEQIWASAAVEVRAEMRRLDGGFLEFVRDGVVARVHNQTTPFTDVVSWRLVDEKPLCYRILREAGLPVPEHRVVEVVDWSAALEFLESVDTPVVVKPARGRGGAGIVGHVRTRDQLRLALASVGRFDERVVIERHVPGEAYRVTLLDGEVLDVLQRLRPRVVGNGSATIADLVLAEDRRRIACGTGAASLKPFNVDHDCVFTLAYQGHDLDTVLPPGREIEIKTVANVSGRDQTRTVLGEVGEAVLATARRAADLLGARLAGVDVMTPDPERPLAEVGGAVLEVNVPGLLYHYDVVNPGQFPAVAVRVLGALLAGPSGGPKVGIDRGSP